jgi:hypothetical protein
MAGHRLQYLTANDWVLMQAKATRRSYRRGEPIIPSSPKEMDATTGSSFGKAKLL